MVKATKPNLLDVLAGMTGEDLEQLDATIATQERELESLRQVRKVVDVRLNGRKRRGGGQAPRPPPARRARTPRRRPGAGSTTGSRSTGRPSRAKSARSWGSPTRAWGS